jgi:uncharacterized protein involved in type VI secretion and phage assembly
MNRRAGVVTAFVKEVDAKQGRVRVEYRGIEDNLLSPWAYMASPLSGSKRGQLFMPEEGDEALVTYADGHFEHPFIVGFLWNGKQNSPEKDAFNRVIVTPGGHQLRFEDKKNDTRIILKSHGKHSITLEDKTAGPLVSVKSNGGREVLLDDAATGGKVQITSGQHQITMDDAPAGTKVTIQAGKGVGVTITLNVTPTPSLSIAVGAGNTLDVSDAGVSLMTSGSVNVTAGSAANVNVGGVATINCTTASLTAAAATQITTGVLSVTAGLSVFSGIVVAPTLVSTSVVSPLYTPGVGNLL